MRAVLREAALSAAAQKSASLVTFVLVAGMCIAILLTSGTAEGNRQAVLATLDTAGTRSIVVRAAPDAHLQSTILARFHGLDGIQSAVAFGPAHDVRNALIPGGHPVPLRDYWGSEDLAVNDQEAVASEAALRELGMQFAVGSVTNEAGIDVGVVGTIRDADALSDYEPLLLRPRHAKDVGDIGAIVLIAKDAAEVNALVEVIRPMVAGDTGNSVSIDASHALAALQGSVDDQLSGFTGLLVAGVFVGAGTLVTIVQTALVVLKRRDWGRRRALGASRSLISALVISQTGIVAAASATAGTLATLISLQVTGDPQPSWRFVCSVAVLAVASSLAAAVLPALLASRRDPITELRVP